jgi:hypothetical protein
LNCDAATHLAIQTVPGLAKMQMSITVRVTQGRTEHRDRTTLSSSSRTAPNERHVFAECGSSVGRTRRVGAAYAGRTRSRVTVAAIDRLIRPARAGDRRWRYHSALALRGTTMIALLRAIARSAARAKRSAGIGF